VKTDRVGDALQIVVERLVSGLSPERIILFGSRAEGTADDHSDVDLLVIVSDSTQLPHRRAQEAYRCVGAVGLPKDLLVLTREEFGRQTQIVSSLARRVKATGKVLYERAEAHRSTAVAHQEPACRCFGVSVVRDAEGWDTNGDVDALVRAAPSSAPSLREGRA
jgi:predicted nucleotidyltransferase